GAGGATAGAGGSASSAAPGAKAATAKGQISGAAAAANDAGAASTQAAQSVDTLGRPLTGDRAKCAPGAQLQENISLSSPPCIPKFVGDNGGATTPGVTGDTINAVIIHPQYPEASQRALQAGGLAASSEQYAESDLVYSTFLNNRYELYGRKLKVFDYYTAAADPA